MDLRQLEYFREIADTGSINEAARRLNMSQPPLSYQLRQLEDELAARGVNVGELELMAETDAGTAEENATKTATEEYTAYNPEATVRNTGTVADAPEEMLQESQDKKLSQQRIFEMLQSVSAHIQPPDIAKRPKKRMKVPLYKDFKKNREQQEQEQIDREAIGADADTVIIYEKSDAGQKIKGILQLVGLIAAVGAAVCGAVIYLM